MKIAITGGIGSGKSYVCRLLEQRGIEVYDCDAAAKRLMRTSDKLQQQLKALVGDAVYSADAASGKQWLESAILFESGFDRRIAFDHIVCVTAPRPVRIQRIVQRDNITPQRAAEWIDVQMSQQEVAHRSDFCIQNDGECDLQVQIDDILRQIAINN